MILVKQKQKCQGDNKNSGVVTGRLASIVQ